MPKSHRRRRSAPESPFKGRSEELELITSEEAKTQLINIYGVAGIGKSRLLSEAALRLREREPKPMLFRVDLLDLPSEPAARPEAFLRLLVAQEPTQLRGTWQSPEQVAADIVMQLNAMASESSSQSFVYLFVDNTEYIQEDVTFWSWMEKNLIGPLIVAGKTRQVYAGRVPVHWSRFEVRRAVQLHSLAPLPTDRAGGELLFQLLEFGNPALSQEEIRQTVFLLADLSFGHPLLSEKLAAYAAPRLPSALQQPEAFRHELSENTVNQFINDFLFEGIDFPWTEILKWACILRQFDPLLLRRFLEKVDEPLVAGKEEYFFIQGLAMLRMHDATIWNVGEGIAVHGILRDILRRNLQVLRPDDFQRACRAAAVIYDELANELSPDSEEAGHYRAEAEYYSQECVAQGSHKEGD